MQLLASNLRKETLDCVVIEVIDVLESFLVRRAVCGIEPTGLHAVFKRLWNDLDGKTSGNLVRKTIVDHKTVAWPTNEDFAANISERQLYGSKIAPYLVAQYDRHLGGDNPSVAPWLEHVLPKTPGLSWPGFSKEQHEKLVDTLSNLIPLSPTMNRELGNRAYVLKKPVYQADAMYKSAREFASMYDDWNPTTLKGRADQLAIWAVERWPHSPS